MTLNGEAVAGLEMEIQRALEKDESDQCDPESFREGDHFAGG